MILQRTRGALIECSCDTCGIVFTEGETYYATEDLEWIYCRDHVPGGESIVDGDAMDDDVLAVIHEAAKDSKSDPIDEITLERYTHPEERDSAEWR